MLKVHQTVTYEPSDNKGANEEKEKEEDESETQDEEENEEENEEEADDDKKDWSWYQKRYGSTAYEASQ
jgi:hypothetical protein